MKDKTIKKGGAAIEQDRNPQTVWKELTDAAKSGCSLP